MNETIQTDLCIIGAGSAGLSIAAGASQMGAKVVLIEGHRMGGDCLNTGCVPSKSLLAAGKAAKIARGSASSVSMVARRRRASAIRPKTQRRGICLRKGQRARS
ncbi:MAG: FAD-dependent oxidoreductase [Sphingomonadales bacterium]|nr:FAD-dependent oxidoreductase [Sphingomonadales bacterium]